MKSVGKVAQYKNLDFYMFKINNNNYINGSRSEHGPAHVHVRFKLTNEDVVYLRYYISKDIEEPIEIISIDNKRRGVNKPPLSKKQKKQALDFIKKHKNELIDIWDKIQSDKEFEQIKEM